MLVEVSQEYKMIRLHPKPDPVHVCPYDNVMMDILDWYIPGMRVFAVVECSRCHRVYYADLPIGQAHFSPMLLEKETGQVTDPNHVTWFSNWLESGYRNRSGDEIGFIVHEKRPARTTSPLVLLNCLDVLYGHCLLKLLNAQYYLDHYPDMDLIVMVPSFLRWMVPEGVAAIWEVDWPLKTGYQWNDWLAQKVKDLATGYREIFVSVAYSHPHPEDYDISRFVGVQPFGVSDWEKRINNPKVTYVWREDRFWAPQVKRLFHPWFTKLHKQAEMVAELAERLRARIAGLEFVVAGLGSREKFPGWVVDMRTDHISEAQERTWCRLYAQSHLVIGVHGSNMLLPSSLAGSVIDLMPDDRWGNILEDVLLRSMDMREAMYCYRFVPISINPNELANMVHLLFQAHRFMLMSLPKNASGHIMHRAQMVLHDNG